MLRKLGSYPRQNGLAVALRELGRIERTLFILDWLQSVEPPPRACRTEQGRSPQRAARAVFFNRLGEIRDRSFEQQRYRASGLNLVTAAIVLWNTVYLERASNALRGHGQTVDDALLQYLSPLGWEHINLTGDYLWRSSQDRRASSGRYDRCNRLSVRFFRFLRRPQSVPHCPGQDQGVYFLAERGERRPDGRQALLAYAVGCNPDTDPFDDWWHLAGRELGGDDFAEYFDPKDGLFTRLQHSADDLVLSATATHLSLAVVPPA